MLKRAIFLSIFFFIPTISPSALGGDSIPAPSSPLTVPVEHNVRVPEKSKINSYLVNKDYQYGGDYKPPANDTILNRLWKWILSLWRRGMKALNYLPVALRVLFYLLCLGLILIIATKTKLYKIFYTDKEIQEPDFSEENPLEETFDFNQAINMQISRQNFRNAIRLLHLKILKELELHGVIRFAREKTNREYAREISDNKLKSDFFALAGIYNRVWFGNYELSRDEYDLLASGFYKFSEEINAQKE